MTILKVLTWMPFEVLELIGQFLFAITVFRIPHRSHKKQLIGISIIVCIVETLVYEVWGLNIILSEVIISLVSYLSIKLAFKTTHWNAFLIFLTGYLADSLFFFLISIFGIADIEHMYGQISYESTAQLCLFVIFTLLSIFFYKKGWGFVFLSEKMDKRPKFRKLNILILSVGFLDISSALVAIYLCYYHHHHLSAITLILFFVLLILFIWQVYLLSVKNVEERFSELNIEKWLP